MRSVTVAAVLALLLSSCDTASPADLVPHDVRLVGLPLSGGDTLRAAAALLALDGAADGVESQDVRVLVRAAGGRTLIGLIAAEETTEMRFRILLPEGDQPPNLTILQVVSDENFAYQDPTATFAVEVGSE